jgi:glyoxylase-like metal-dependent hydrolase (beta-lactamase superfamily II)
MINIVDLNFLGYNQAIAAFLVPTSDGLVLVETGPHSTLPTLLQQIEILGYRPDQVRHVLLTHIHLDHAGAAWYFAQLGAKVYVHPVGLPHLQSPERLMSSATRIYGDDMNRLWGQMKAIKTEQLIAVNHGQTLTFGNRTFEAWHTPGHAVHHIVWKLGRVLFTGDVAGVKIFEGPVMPPCPPPDIDIEAWNQSIELILKADIDELYLTHFGKITNVRPHFEQLHYFLNDWYQWMSDHLQAESDLNKLIPLFQQHVGKQLVKLGLSENEIEVYEAANPSWMSVYGLSRYIKKKNR